MSDERDRIRTMSRRAVLRAGAIGVAATGAVTAFPGLISELGTEAPEVDGDVSGTSEGLASQAAATDGPIVAHIRDVSTGDLSLYVGEREVAYRDPALVGRLLRAAGR